ncbi:N-chimaerin-like isoform X2 [Biomphalaria glabrata]|uniref:Beta-chimaerin n=1 Tax=Biomphalaria glabrata TaxID=6526 RepID=A0A9W2YC52_BIOGL|nr:N-chimaerin-like isoform X2 [Biomphalaria glabrata]
MSEKRFKVQESPALVRLRKSESPMAATKASERKLAARFYSTDTAMDYTQGYREDLDGDKANCRRSASLQQHSTIGTGVYKKNIPGDVNSGTLGTYKKPAPVVRQRLKRKDDYYTVVADGEDTQSVPTWNTYLYQLQQQAPKPVCIQCQQEVPNKPPQYGKEFHGTLSRQEADRLLQSGDGCYLVRKSDRAPDAFTLAIRFEGETKNYKLYYDGKHYVGEKRFDSIHDLVADGLIHFFIELRAADYIKTLSQESNYEESPYMAYNMKRKRMGKSKTDANVKVMNNEALQLPMEVDDSGPATDVNEYEKPHIFKVQNFMGLHWCDFCANFMWGLLAQGVKCQDCGFQAHKKCSEKVPNDCMPDMKYVKRIFGGDLTTVVKAQKSLIPIVVEKCVKEIEARGMDMEGLYRLAGFHDDVEAVRMAFDKDAENTDISSSKYEDINTICSALKLYFRLLPIPLITCDVYKKLMEIIKTEDLTVSDQVKLMKEPLSSLPPAHFHTLKFMCAHLGRVVENKSKNMMSFENLAIVFAPTLLRSDDADPMASLMAAKFEQKIMDVILSNHIKLLGK